MLDSNRGDAGCRKNLRSQRSQAVPQHGALSVYHPFHRLYLSGDASQLTVAYFVQGVAAGMIIPIAQAYVGDLSPKTEEGKWQVYFNAAFFSGFGLGPLMGGALTVILE
nr:MFS transporter [Desulfobacterales bacterium]